MLALKSLEQTFSNTLESYFGAYKQRMLVACRDDFSHN